jgi:hypothetical protein
MQKCKSGIENKFKSVRQDISKVNEEVCRDCFALQLMAEAGKQNVSGRDTVMLVRVVEFRAVVEGNVCDLQRGRSEINALKAP